MNTNTVTLVGNLVDTPEVSVTQSAAVRARFRLAHTDRRRDPVTETWQDGDSLFLDVICWRRLAENVGNSLQKGDRVIVVGRLRQWTAERDGLRRHILEVEAETVGPDLQRGIATVARSRRAWSAGEDTGAGRADAAAASLIGGGSDGTEADRGIDSPDDAALGSDAGQEAGTEAQWERALVEVGG